MIKLLDQLTINKISAGEVIERPSSVVKELVENAIDSSASAITVEIKEGGLSFIRITDNGGGIKKEEVKTAFLRHATSKIDSADDLFTVASLGFRGEALASIAAVSQVEMITKVDRDLTGVRYVIEGGKEQQVEEIGAPSGTTIIVRNLFFNTPARRKFMKTPSTEGSYIAELINRLALSRPDISFKFINNGQNKLYTSGNGNLKDIIYNLYGKDITKNLIEINAQTEDFSLTGYIAKPYISKGNRTYENYFINERYIKSSVITSAIETAYQTFVMVHKYPFTTLKFNITKELLDINVHPTKMELKISNHQELYSFIVEQLRLALTEKELIPTVTISQPTKVNKPAIVSTPEPFELKRKEEVKEEIIKEDSFKMNSSAVVSPKINIKTQENINKPNILDDYTVIQEKRVEVSPSSSLDIKPTLYSSSSNSIPSTTEKEYDSQISKLNVGEPHTNKTESLISQTQHNIKRSDSSYNEIHCSKDQEVSNIHISDSDNQNITDIEYKVDSNLELVNNNIITSTQPQLNLFEHQLLSPTSISKHRLIGQLFNTYWLIEYEQQLFIMDQHAAHEKIMFEKLLTSLKTNEVYGQQLMPGIIITLNPREADVLDNNMDLFSRLGFSIEEFGGNEYMIRSVPSNLMGISGKELFEEFVGDLLEDANKITDTIFVEKLSSMACKAAIKGNQKLSYQEAEALIEELMTLENPYNCPHGRPTLIVMSEKDIEKKFRRIQN